MKWSARSITFHVRGGEKTVTDDTLWGFLEEVTDAQYVPSSPEYGETQMAGGGEAQDPEALLAEQRRDAKRKLAELDDQLFRAREAKLARRESASGEHEEKLAEREKELAEREKELAEREKELAEREQTAARLEGGIKRREDGIKRREDDLKRREDDLKRHEDDLKSNKTEIRDQLLALAKSLEEPLFNNSYDLNDPQSVLDAMCSIRGLDDGQIRTLRAGSNYEKKKLAQSLLRKHHPDKGGSHELAQLINQYIAFIGR